MKNLSDKKSKTVDERWMRAALLQARFGQGQTPPNPSVGCVIIDASGRLAGRGHTAVGGRPHAETIALTEAGKKAQNGTAYVTLEPCAHHGETPPCAAALITAGIKRVVVACLDPDERVAGKGLAMLGNAGVEIQTGILEDEAAALLGGYFTLRQSGRPKIILKIASSLDGRIALNNGRSQWITGAAARRYAHEIRSRVDAVLTSSGTARADNPQLTVRLPGYAAPQPLRAVVGRVFDLKPESHLVLSASSGKVLFYSCAKGAKTASPVEEISVAAGVGGYPDLHQVFADLGGRGVASVLVECGGKFAASLLQAGLVDEIIWLRSAAILGGDGLSAFGALGLTDLAASPSFTRRNLQMIGDDVVEILRRAECSQVS